jgi:Phage integrase family
MSLGLVPRSNGGWGLGLDRDQFDQKSGGVLSRASWAWPWVEAGLVDGWAPLDVSDEPAPQCPAPRFDLVQLLRPHDARLSCRRRIEFTTSGCQRAGLRLGEVMGLRWQDIDFYGRSPKVNQVLQITMEFDIPKTHRSSRTVSLPAFVVEALKRQRKRQNERRLIIGQAWQDFGLVIDRGDGAPLRACVSMAQTVDLACPSTWHGSGEKRAEGEATSCRAAAHREAPTNGLDRLRNVLHQHAKANGPSWWRMLLASMNSSIARRRTRCAEASLVECSS